MNSAKTRSCEILAWFGSIHGILVIICFISGFLFSSLDAYERIWFVGHILTFGLAEPEFIPYPDPTWLGVWLICLTANRILGGKFRLIPWRDKF